MQITPFHLLNFRQDVTILGMVATEFAINSLTVTLRRGLVVGLPYLLKGVMIVRNAKIGMVTVTMHMMRSFVRQGMIVMYVSSKCRFSTESGPFYERITGERGNDVNFIAVMPQPVDEGREYLSKLGVKITDVYQAPLQPIGVRSTATLLLVDGSGVVTDSWVGKLTPEREDHVKSKLTE